MKRVLVTSGGTSEPIDQVRRITNLSTGRLGALIADAFTRAGAEVDYVCGETAARPSLPPAGVHPVGGVASLAETLERLLTERPYFCVVHAMAVSDYTPRRVTTADAIAEAIASLLAAETTPPDRERLEALVREALRQGTAEDAKKISSHLDDMVLLMERTPKVIGRVKALQPETLLVGFKLLAGASEQALVAVAQSLMTRNGCDYVLANDQEQISESRHSALLVGSAGILRRMETKAEIAEAIVEAVFA